LALELESHGLKYQKEVSFPLLYKNKKIEHCFRLDFLIENEIVLELKSVETVLPVHEAQLLTYLRISNKEIGLLINFNVPVLKQGIRRCILSANELTNAPNIEARTP
jgi:GxxExxY protein